MRSLQTVQLIFLLLVAMCAVAKAQDHMGSPVAISEKMENFVSSSVAKTNAAKDSVGGIKLQHEGYLLSTSLNVNQATLIKDRDPAFICLRQESDRSLDGSFAKQEPSEQQDNQTSAPKWQYGGGGLFATP